MDCDNFPFSSLVKDDSKMWYLLLEFAAMLDVADFPPKWFHFCISGLITRSSLFGRKLTVQTGTSFFDDAAKNMASDCDCAESQLMNCFKVEIILKRNNDDSILLWRWKDENKWELPWFLLRETESFQQEIQRWCSNQLVSNVCGFTLAIVCTWRQY